MFVLKKMGFRSTQRKEIPAFSSAALCFSTAPWTELWTQIFQPSPGTAPNRPSAITALSLLNTSSWFMTSLSPTYQIR